MNGNLLHSANRVNPICDSARFKPAGSEEAIYTHVHDRVGLICKLCPIRGLHPTAMESAYRCRHCFARKDREEVN